MKTPKWLLPNILSFSINEVAVIVFLSNHKISTKLSTRKIADLMGLETHVSISRAMKKLIADGLVTDEFKVVENVDNSKIVSRMKHTVSKMKQKKDDKEEVNNTFVSKMKQKKTPKSTKNVGTTLRWIEQNKKKVLVELNSMFPDKNVEKAYDRFVEANKVKSYGYKNYYEALKRWIREDRFGEYSKHGSKIVNGRVIAPDDKYDY